jgi:hypothetical protein
MLRPQFFGGFLVAELAGLSSPPRAPIVQIFTYFQVDGEAEDEESDDEELGDDDGCLDGSSATDPSNTRPSSPSPEPAGFPYRPTLAVDRCLLRAGPCSANVATLHGYLATDFLSWPEGMVEELRCPHCLR